jgi:hypothetical protein
MSNSRSIYTDFNLRRIISKPYIFIQMTPLICGCTPFSRITLKAPYGRNRISTLRVANLKSVFNKVLVRVS